MVHREVLGEAVLVPTAQSVADFERTFAINRVGSIVWQHLDGARDADALCAILREKFAVPDGHDLRADVDRFLSALVERKLVERAA